MLDAASVSAVSRIGPDSCTLSVLDAARAAFAVSTIRDVAFSVLEAASVSPLSVICLIAFSFKVLEAANVAASKFEAAV